MRVFLTGSHQQPKRTNDELRKCDACARDLSSSSTPTSRAEATLEAMRFTLTLLFGTIGVLITGGKDPDDSEEVRAVLMELSFAHDEITSLKMDIDRLKEELDQCVQGHSCPSVVRTLFHLSWC